MSLALAVVRVLAEDQHLHPLVRCRVQRGEDLFARRVDGTLGSLLLDELGEFLEVGLLQFLAQDAAPGLGQHGGVGHVNFLRCTVTSRPQNLQATTDTRPRTPCHQRILRCHPADPVPAAAGPGPFRPPSPLPPPPRHRAGPAPRLARHHDRRRRSAGPPRTARPRLLGGPRDAPGEQAPHPGIEPSHRASPPTWRGGAGASCRRPGRQAGPYSRSVRAPSSPARPAPSPARPTPQVRRGATKSNEEP